MDRIEPYLERVARVEHPVVLEMEALAREREFPIVGPQVGRLLDVVARAARARSVLELGSGFGYSAWWFLRATAPDGFVEMTDGSEERAARARDFLSRSGYDGRFRVQVGDAFEIASRFDGPFDVLFNDVDKHDYPRVHEVAKRLLRVGGLLISDNMLWKGKVADPEPDDAWTQGVLELTRRIKSDADFVSTLLPVRDGVMVSYRVR